MAKKIERQDNSRLVEDLEELCVDIFAHAENDYEITLSGNGINACEASGVACAILELLHGDGRKWRDSNEKRISKRAAELRKENGDE